MNLALRKIIYDPISYIHPQRVSLNNTPINNPVLRSITNEMIVLQYNLSVEHFNLNSSLIYYINNWNLFPLFCLFSGYHAVPWTGCPEGAGRSGPLPPGPWHQAAGRQCICQGSSCSKTVPDIVPEGCGKLCNAHKILVPGYIVTSLICHLVKPPENTCYFVPKIRSPASPSPGTI